MSRGSVWIVGILALSLLMAGGLWVWMTSAAQDQRPEFQSIDVDPPVLRFSGGRVIVQAQVTDDSGLSSVSGSVIQGDSRYRQLPTQVPPPGSREFTYVTEFPALPNTRNDGIAVGYLVRLVAVDSAGQETIGETSFQVAAPPPPPAPPSTSFSP